MSLLLALLGCGSPSVSDTGTAPVDAATCDASGGRRHWVMTGLTFVRVQEDGSSDGFDLDGEVTEICVHCPASSGARSATLSTTESTSA